MDLQKQKALTSFVAGSLAGPATQLISYPMDVIRTRITGLLWVSVRVHVRTCSGLFRRLGQA